MFLMIKTFNHIFQKFFKVHNVVNNKISSPEQIFKEIYKSHQWSGISKSGPGSDLTQTKVIREELPKIIKELKIASLLDIPCGDFFWLKEVDLGFVNYIGADIVDDVIIQNRKMYLKKNRTFQKLNIIDDELPKVDLVFCRDLFVHFSFEDIFKSINHIIKSDSKFLLTTSFISRKKNKNISTGDWRTLNLQISPFFFPQPIGIINEKCEEGNGKFYDKSLLLWDVKELGKNIINRIMKESLK